MPSLIDTDMLTPTAGDESVKLIDSLLGRDWHAIWSGATAATEAPSALYNILAVFNMLVLAGVVVLFFWVIAQGVLGTASEGKPLGSRYSTLWTPIRSAVAVGMLMPLPWGKGLSLLQSALLASIHGGIGLADTAWTAALDHMGQNAGAVSTQYRPGSAASELARGILDIRTAQRVMAEQMGAPVPGRVTEWEPSGEKTGTWRIQFFPASGLSLRPVDMGHITIACTDGHSGAGCTSQREAVETLIDDLGTVAEAAASWHSEGSQTPVNPPDITAAVARYETAIAASIPAMKSEADADYQAGLADFVEAAGEMGWISAGSWYWTLAKYNQRAGESAGTVPILSPMATEAVSRAVDGKLDTYFSVVRRAEEISTHDARGIAQGPASGIVGWFNRHVFGGPYAVINPAEMLTEGDPVGNLQSVGHTVLSGGMGLAAAWVAGASAAKAADGAGDSLWGKALELVPGAGAAKAAATEALVGFFESASPWVIMLVLPLLFGGIGLAFYLPAVPFVIWTMGVIGWLILVVETLIAAPLWAAAHAIPEGEGIAGQHGRQGYMLFLGVLFRPALMVVGLFSGMLLLTVVGKLIGRGLTIFAAGMSADHIAGPITFIALMFLCGGLVIAAAHKLFGLITWIPEHIMQWIGHQGTALGEDRDEGRAHHSFAAAFTTGQSAIQQARGEAHRGGGGAGGKGGKKPSKLPGGPSEKSPDAKTEELL